jgi:hypothetical protein
LIGLGGVRQLIPKGFIPYKIKELTPNKTRRGQLGNWLIYYREKLFGKTIEELKKEREEARFKEQQELGQGKSDSNEELPSETMFKKFRLDTDRDETIE